MEGRTEAADAGQSRIQTLNREIILQAALETFSVHGFRGSTLEEIARRAGLSKPNLLYYYPRKLDIYEAVLRGTLALWLEPLADISAEGEPIEELRRYVTKKLRMSQAQPEASRLFANEILAGAPVIGAFLAADLRALVEEKAGVIRGWVSAGRLAPIDPVHLIFAIWATTQHYADFDVQVRAILGDQVGRAGFPEQAAQAVLSIILNGVRPR